MTDIYITQQMGKNLVTHRQTYDTLRMLAEKLDATMTRIKDVEADMERLFTQIQHIADDDDDDAKEEEQQDLLKFKDLILSRMQNIAKESKSDIQNDLVHDTLTKKRKQRDLDEMLYSFLDFINST